MISFILYSALRQGAATACARQRQRLAPLGRRMSYPKTHNPEQKRSI